MRTKEWYEACIKAQAERIRNLEQEVRNLEAKVTELLREIK